LSDAQTIHDAETSVLGSILQQPDLIDDCFLQPDEFADERHQLIMEYFRYLVDIGKPIDLVVMAEQSGKNLARIGGVQYLVQLAGSVPTVGNFGHYQDIIHKTYIHRRTVQMLSDMADAGKREGIEVNEYVGSVQAALDDITSLTEKNQNDVVKMSDTLIDHDKTIRKRREQRGITGAKTASLELDRMTGGHQDGDLEIIAARPSMGKTAFFINDMIATARSGRPALLFSLEMSKEKIAERALCVLGNIDNTKLRTGNLDDQDWERWSYAMDELDRIPLYIDDTPGITLQQIGAKVKRMIKKYPNLVVYIDFLQLVNPGRKFTKEHEGVAYVSKGLKQTARRNNVPVVAISAVGRQCEQRQDKRPMMSDLRESGSIESDADIIAFLYRDDYYNPQSEKKSIVEIIIAKGRNVGIGTIEMVFDKKTGKFLNIDRTAKEGATGGNKRKDHQR